MWKLVHMLLKHQWVNEEINEESKKYLKTKKWEQSSEINRTQQKLI